MRMYDRLRELEKVGRVEIGLLLENLRLKRYIQPPLI